MKKIILVAALSVICTASFAQKFAHVNSQELFQLMPEMDAARAQMDGVVKENEDVMKTMYDELQTKYQQYQQKASTWTAAVKEVKEKELQDLQNRIQESQQTMQQEMQSIQAQLTAPVMKKCQEAIEAAAKAGGYIYVFDVASALYIDPAQSTDLTPQLRKTLNIPEGRTLETLQKELEAKQAADAAADAQK